MASLVNEEQSRKHGDAMIHVARSLIEKDHSINSSFIRCIQVAGIYPMSACIPQLYGKLSLKLFHARVNEFMTASTEIQ